MARRAEACQFFTGSHLTVLDAFRFFVKSSFADFCSMLRASDTGTAPTPHLLTSHVNWACFPMSKMGVGDGGGCILSSETDASSLCGSNYRGKNTPSRHQVLLRPCPEEQGEVVLCTNHEFCFVYFMML